MPKYKVRWLEEHYCTGYMEIEGLRETADDEVFELIVENVTDMVKDRAEYVLDSFDILEEIDV